MLFEIFDRTGFFRIVGEEIEFRHHLLQEFFAGRGIESSDFVKVAMVDEWWKRALVFYFGANPDRIELLREAMDAVSGIEPGKLLEAATTVGLALQACYLSPVSDKLDIWKWVVTALDLCQDAWLNQTSTNKKYPLSEYIQYYLYTRDSVALSHLKQNIASLLAWAEQPPGIVAKGAEKHGAFWLLVGLVESGEISEAQRILQQLTLQDGRIVTAIYLGFSIACQIRPLPHAEKEKAREVCRQMEKQFEPYRAQLLSEFGSALLEMRKGQVKAIDEEAEM